MNAIALELRRSYSVHSTRGLTLVELVVVLGCAACLVAVMGAAVSIPGRPNRERMCAYHLSQVGSAMLQYTIEESGWLPGSPGTSGAVLVYEHKYASADAENIPEPPTQIWDWAAPLAGYLGVSLDANRALRSEQLTHGPYWCPANGLVVPPYPGPSGNWHAMRMLSYDSMRMFNYFEETAPLDPALERYAVWQGVLPILLPAGYRPHMSYIGSPAGKVFVADGSRYTDESGMINWNYDLFAGYGGAFADGGPTIREDALRSYFLGPEELAANSYRHVHNDTMGLNALHFDGHVEWISEPASRHPARWYPSGTIIARTAMNRLTRQSVRDDLTPDLLYFVP